MGNESEFEKKNMSVICLAVAILILAETHTCADFSGQVSPALFVTMLNRKSITVMTDVFHTGLKRLIGDVEASLI